MCLPICNDLTALLGVISSIGINRVNLLILWNLIPSTCESLTLLVVSWTARICRVLASIPIWSLRHWRRYSGPCFLRFHSPLARNFMPVESMSRRRPIGCAVDFVCRLLHLKIISMKKPVQIGLCNKAEIMWKIIKKQIYLSFLKKLIDCLIKFMQSWVNLFEKFIKMWQNSPLLRI